MTGIDMDRVEFAARTANADEFIGRLPDGYQTNVGLRGSVFSGGQKQRYANADELLLQIFCNWDCRLSNLLSPCLAKIILFCTYKPKS